MITDAFSRFSFALRHAEYTPLAADIAGFHYCHFRRRHFHAADARCLLRFLYGYAYFPPLAAFASPPLRCTADAMPLRYYADAMP